MCSTNEEIGVDDAYLFNVVGHVHLKTLVDEVSKCDNSYYNKYYGAGQGVGVFDRIMKIWWPVCNDGAIHI